MGRLDHVDMVNALDDYKFVPNKPAGECIITQKKSQSWMDRLFEEYMHKHRT